MNEKIASVIFFTFMVKLAMKIWIIIALVALLALIVIVLYNGLIRRQMLTKEAWAQIDVQLKRRNDLIPNLVNSVKAYATHEKTTFEQVTSARTALTNAPSTVEAMTASNQLTSGLSRLMMVAEAYPELKADTNFLKLQTELTTTENKIAMTRQLYNSATGNYNAKLRQFPWNLLAKLFQLKAADFFQTTTDEARNVPITEGLSA